MERSILQSIPIYYVGYIFYVWHSVISGKILVENIDDGTTIMVRDGSSNGTLASVTRQGWMDYWIS